MNPVAENYVLRRVGDDLTVSLDGLKCSVAGVHRPGELIAVWVSEIGPQISSPLSPSEPDITAPSASLPLSRAEAIALTACLQASRADTQLLLQALRTQAESLRRPAFQGGA